MRLSTCTSTIALRFGDRKAIKILKDAGFDAYDYSFYEKNEDQDPILKDDWRGYYTELKKYADELGISCNQAHARFSTARFGQDEWNERQYKLILRDIEAAAILGADAIVIHPVHNGYPDEGSHERNVEFYSGLIPYCEKFGIKVALENMWKVDPKRHYIIEDVCNGSDKFVRMIDELNNPKCFTACLDVGHSALIGEEPRDAVRNLGHRLGALHIHDVNYVCDSHTLPYLEKLEWDNILRALAEVGYDGDFTFEANNFPKAFPDELVPEAAKFMAVVGRYMMGKIEEYKKCNG